MCGVGVVLGRCDGGGGAVVGDVGVVGDADGGDGGGARCTGDDASAVFRVSAVAWP